MCLKSCKNISWTLFLNAWLSSNSWLNCFLCCLNLAVFNVWSLAGPFSSTARTWTKPGKRHCAEQRGTCSAFSNNKNCSLWSKMLPPSCLDSMWLIAGCDWCNLMFAKQFNRHMLIPCQPCNLWFAKENLECLMRCCRWRRWRLPWKAPCKRRPEGVLDKRNLQLLECLWLNFWVSSPLKCWAWTSRATGHVFSDGVKFHSFLPHCFIVANCGV